MTRQPHIARRAEELLGSAVAATAPIAGGDIATATKLRLSSGRSAFMKTLTNAPVGFFEAEADGLRWLGEAGGVRVPEVLAVEHDCLILDWIEPGKLTTEAASDFGRALAKTHDAGAPAYGLDRDGFIGKLPLPNKTAPTWAEFYATKRVLPYLKLALDRGAITPEGAETVEGIVGKLPDLVPEEGPRRHPRRPLERQRHLDARRRLLRDRPRRTRRPPRDRPGHARAVRPAAPAAGIGRLRGGLTPRRRLGGPRRRCTSCTRSSSTRACSAVGTALGRRRWPSAMPDAARVSVLLRHGSGRFGTVSS